MYLCKSSKWNNLGMWDGNISEWGPPLNKLTYSSLKFSCLYIAALILHVATQIVVFLLVSFFTAILNFSKSEEYGEETKIWRNRGHKKIKKVERGK